MTCEQEALASAMLRAGAIKFGEFTLKSGQYSPLYIDLRLLRSFPSVFTQGVNALRELVGACGQFDLIADVPTAATPWVSVLMYIHKLPMISPRESKGHGTKASIEGEYHVGQRVVVIEDLVTTGGSTLSMIKILETAKLVVRDVCVLVDRGQGGKAKLEQAGYRLHAVFTLRELLDYYRIVNTIKPHQLDLVNRYLDDSPA